MTVPVTHLIRIQLSDGSTLRSAITFTEGQWFGAWGQDEDTGLARLHPVHGETLDAMCREQAQEVHHDAFMAEDIIPEIVSVTGPLLG